MAVLALGLVILGLGHMRLVRVAHTHEAPPARPQASAAAEMASDRVAARVEANRLTAEEAASARAASAKEAEANRLAAEEAAAARAAAAKEAEANRLAAETMEANRIAAATAGARAAAEEAEANRLAAEEAAAARAAAAKDCLLYTSPSPRDATLSRMPSSA